MSAPLHAFEGFGIELEFMIVDAATLEVRPLAPQLLQQGGTVSGEYARGTMGWSNELVQHVVEVKNLRPNAELGALPALFQAELDEIDRRLAAHGARLMPGAMHPWMDPLRETRIWEDGNDAIYRAYDRIFDCRSHGWANLQSMHVNLPFADDAEFARLHAAVRLVLPLLPALAASSPIADAQISGLYDTRMRAYWTNAQAFPEITGTLVPETVADYADYQARILEPMYQAIAPHDPQRVLRHEWLNSRAAIARFERNAIEIRLIDTQECVQADLAIAAATIAVVRGLYLQALRDAPGSRLAAQQEIETNLLARLLSRCIRDGERAVIDNARYLAMFDYPGAACSAQQLWEHLLTRNADELAPWLPTLQPIRQHGPLARRILAALPPGSAAPGAPPSRSDLHTVYLRLCECLREGKPFIPPSNLPA